MFRTTDKDYLKVFKKLRGYFGEQNLAIGGSYVYSKELEIEWNHKDIDIFFLMPRMESWALVNILNLIFDVVAVFPTDTPEQLNHKDKYYKINRQWKRIMAYKDGMTYDLIFVDDNIDNLIIDNTGSDISRLYYQITYRVKTLQLSTHSTVALRRLEAGTCWVYPNMCTIDYLNKIEKLCVQLKLEKVLEHISTF